MEFFYRLPILFGLVGVAQAYTKFETKCSVPTDTANFVSSPDTRGTLDILWSSFFTIIACTWTIQHLNVPEQRNGRDPGIFGDMKWALKGSWTTTKWMLITILAPEILLGKALSDYLSAKKSRKDMKDFSVPDKVEWELCHGFFADMGGFRVRESPNASPKVKQDSTDVSEASPSDEIRESTASETPLAVTSMILYELRNKNAIRLPDITVSELNDKSKGSLFIKAITIGQVLWNTIQIIARASRGLTVTQLELAVTAFSLCATIIYILLLHKPQGVHAPARTIDCHDYSGGRFERSIIKENEKATTPCTVLVTFDIPIAVDTPSWAYIPNNLVQIDFSLHFFLGGIIGGAVFGSIHIAGWNLSFHNPTELLLWRIASLCITVALPVIGLSTFIAILRDPESDDLGWDLVLYKICNLITIVLYVMARLFLLVEYFRTLFFLPPDAYVSTWASNMPHLA